MTESRNPVAYPKQRMRLDPALLDDNSQRPRETVGHNEVAPDAKSL
jgi:hypothetical protein